MYISTQQADNLSPEVFSVGVAFLGENPFEKGFFPKPLS